jgi:hypothetical protein
MARRDRPGAITWHPIRGILERAVSGDTGATSSIRARVEILPGVEYLFDYNFQYNFQEA